jgi:hypothetical protein
MSSVVSGSITAFFLFDVAEAIDLPGVQSAIGAERMSCGSGPRR